MALLEVKDVCFNYSDKELYRSVSFKINNGEHCALVGVNGSGKTTLLELISGNLRPDKGSIIWEPHVSFSYLDQQLKVEKDMPLGSYLYGVYADLFAKEREMESYYERSASGEGDYETLLNKALRIQDELEEKGFYALEEKVGRLSNGLGLDKSMMGRSLKHLSSGEREKAYLCKMLLEEHDVLLMDEPTNFLDANQVEWLAGFLSSYPKAFLLVSHDQAFLKKVANVVFCLENQTVLRYKGDFDEYIANHALYKEQYKKNYEAQQRYIKKEEDFIARHIVRATSAKAAKSRRARLAHLDRMEAPGKEEGRVHFDFPFTKEVGKEVLQVEELLIGYDHPLLAPISFNLLKGEKIAILGQNGVGKSTFLKTVLGLIPSLGGKYHWLEGATINYFGQDEDIDMNLSPFEYISLHYPKMSNTEIRTLLGSYGVRKELAMRKMAELSGGEMSKSRLALMSLSKANFLVFDEPSNHLDQKAKDALFAAIERFPGGVILVSHEKDFYDGLVDYEISF